MSLVQQEIDAFTRIRQRDITKIKKEIEAYRRERLAEVLNQLTESQRAFFLRMYPDGVGQIPNKKIDWAIQQCLNTIKHNRTQDES